MKSEDDWKKTSEVSKPDCVANCAGFTSDGPTTSFAIGRLEANAASRSGSNIDFVEIEHVGIRLLLRLLFRDSMMLPLLLSKGLFKLLNACLLKTAGSTVSKGSTGTVVSLIGTSYVDELYVGGAMVVGEQLSGMVFGEQGGESSDCGCSPQPVSLLDWSDNPSGIAEIGE